MMTHLNADVAAFKWPDADCACPSKAHAAALHVLLPLRDRFDAMRTSC